MTVCIPARDEAPHGRRVVRAVAGPHVAAAGGSGLVDEVLVVDDGSADGTADAARPGRGEGPVAWPAGAARARPCGPGSRRPPGDLVVFLDADVENTPEAFVAGLLGPLLVEEDVALVKGFYDRPLHGGRPGAAG